VSITPAEQTLVSVVLLAQARGLTALAVDDFQFRLLAAFDDERGTMSYARARGPTVVLTAELTALFPSWGVSWFAAATGLKVPSASAGKYTSPEAAMDAVRRDFEVLDARWRLQG
jgi:hypothetical protein